MGDQTANVSAVTAISLSSIRDINVCRQLFPSATISAELFGLATSVKVRENFAFFNIHDGTGSIQVAARPPEISTEDLKKCNNIKPYDRLRVKGNISHFKQRDGSAVTTLFLSEIPLVRSGDKASSTERDLLEHDIDNVGTQLFLARIRARGASFFRDTGFLDLETRSISVAWPEEGVRPLRIDYPGYGTPVFLVPSPRTQLLKAIILTGRDRVFSTSKCFSPTYRDRLVSAESPFISALWLNADFESLIDCAEKAVRFVFDDISTTPSEMHLLQPQWKRIPSNWPPTPGLTNIQVPEIHIYKDFVGDNVPSERIRSVFRLCWPPDILIAEGADEVLHDTATTGTIAIHLERLTAVVKGSRRQVQDLTYSQ